MSDHSDFINSDPYIVTEVGKSSEAIIDDVFQPLVENGASSHSVNEWKNAIAEAIERIKASGNIVKRKAIRMSLNRVNEFNHDVEVLLNEFFDENGLLRKQLVRRSTIPSSEELRGMSAQMLEINLPVVEGSQTVEEMRDLLSELIIVLTNCGVKESDARAAIAEYTEDDRLKELINGKTEDQSD